MNKKIKLVEPFHYPDTFLLLLGYAKIYFFIFRIDKQRRYYIWGHAKGKVPSIPDYTTINTEG